MAARFNWLLVLLLALAVGFAAVVLNRPNAPAEPPSARFDGEASDAPRGKPDPAGMAVHTDSREPSPVRVAADANPNVVSVVEAARNGKHPERLSYMTLPKPFDKAAYEADPDAYLNVVEPGRVRQALEPGEGVPFIRENGLREFNVKSGGSVDLSVIAIKNAPVTFKSFDGGAFSNGLNSISVKADEKGVAVVKFTATKGTIAEVNIIAASPMTSDQINFVVRVEK